MSAPLANAVVRAVHELQREWSVTAKASPATRFDEGYEKGARDVLTDLQRLIAERVVAAFLAGDASITVEQHIITPKQAS